MLSNVAKKDLVNVAAVMGVVILTFYVTAIWNNMLSIKKSQIELRKLKKAEQA